MRLKDKGERRKDRSREVVKLGSWDAEGLREKPEGLTN